MLAAADELRNEMQQQGSRVRDLVLSQPPVQLLAYLWSQYHMAVFAALRENSEEYRPDKELIQTFQFAFEYLHAVWSCHSNFVGEDTSLSESTVAEIIDVLGELQATTMMYCLASSSANVDNARAGLEYHAKSSWVLIRGNRYQVLEEEFFRFVLSPHADALKAVYGMSPEQIAAGIQAAANALRKGFSQAVQTLERRIDESYQTMKESEIELDAAVEALRESDRAFTTDVSGAVQDVLFGGICNLSRHTNFTTPLLEDLSFCPGENVEFFADGDFVGTPMRTLPALIKPGINLDGEYYFTDGQFVRDACYRTIQRGLLRRLPTYREDWNRRQRDLVEHAFPVIFGQQLAAAEKYSGVFFKDPKSGQWAETDFAMTLGDVLLIVEAKAGVMAMASPATNFDRHERAIRDLIVKAYEQCKRFLEYLSSADEAPLYKRIDDEFVEVGRIRMGNFRLVVPIGLTVEAFTPFSAMSKELAGIRPILAKHAFVSMSVDDLFVLNRFLPTTGELFHYLEVRQQAAAIPKAMLFDEIEHLGAYITNNRFDMTIKEQLDDASWVAWDSFGDVVDKYFESDAWETLPAPCQSYPSELIVVLQALETHRPKGWLDVDSQLRSLNSSARENLAEFLENVRATLSKHAVRRFLLGGDNPLQFWLCQSGIEPSFEEMRRHGEVACLATKSATVGVLNLWYDANDEIVNVACARFSRPTAIQSDYAELMGEAKRQLDRSIDLGT